MTRLIIPSVPVGVDVKSSSWMNDIVRYLQALQNSVNSLKSLPTVAYVDTPKLRGIESQLVFVPDHPMGPSIIVFDGVDFQRFTSVGVL